MKQIKNTDGDRAGGSPPLKSADRPPVEDLIDFHNRWQEFRPNAVKALSECQLDLPTIQTMKWLIALADRVTELDLSPSDTANRENPL